MEYMTMKQAFECNDEDSPFLQDGFNSAFRKSKKHILENPKSFSVYPGHALSESWQVQKAEPKVLSADEWVEKNIGKYWGRWSTAGVSTETEFGIESFRAGDKNGQLKEWNRMKEFREAVSVLYEKAAHEAISTITKKVLEEFKNLTPPYQQ